MRRRVWIYTKTSGPRCTYLNGSGVRICGFTIYHVHWRGRLLDAPWETLTLAEIKELSDDTYTDLKEAVAAE